MRGGDGGRQMAGSSRAAATPAGGKPLANGGREDGSQNGELGAAGGIPAGLR